MKLDKMVENINNDRFILSISYGNYRQSIGGTDKVILSHQIMLNTEGISYIYIFPVAKTLRINQIKMFNCFWGLIIDGTYEGIFNTNEIINLIIKASNQKQFNNIFIHHFLGISIDQLERILDFSDVPISMYIHDYYTVCTQVNLMKNDIVYCGEDRINDVKCENCKYYDASITHVNIIEGFLKKYIDRIMVVTPSESAKRIWLSAYPIYKNKVIVLNHQTSIGEYKGNFHLIGDTDKMKIAYVGAQATKKGWDEWEKAVSTINNFNIGNKEFYHFGKTKDELDYIKKIPVSFQKDGINAMVSELRKNNIDCVVLWSICPETYSYTYYESTASNAFIITNRFSGNIADSVAKRNNGIVLGGTKELIDLLNDEERLKSLINNFRKRNEWGPDRIVENRALLKNISDSGANIYFEKGDNKLSAYFYKIIIKFVLEIAYNLYMNLYASRRLKKNSDRRN